MHLKICLLCILNISGLVVVVCFLQCNNHAVKIVFKHIFKVRPFGYPHVPASCQCFSCSKSGDGMELAESWSSCFVAFLGLPLLSSTQAGGRGGEEWKHLAAMSKTVLGCSWSPHPPWVWFYSHGPGGVEELEWGGLPVGTSQCHNRYEQEKCLCRGSFSSLGTSKLLKMLFERDFAQMVRQRRCIWYPLLQGTTALWRTR